MDALREVERFGELDEADVELLLLVAVLRVADAAGDKPDLLVVVGDVDVLLPWNLHKEITVRYVSVGKYLRIVNVRRQRCFDSLS